MRNSLLVTHGHNGLPLCECLLYLYPERGGLALNTWQVNKAVKRTKEIISDF